MESENNNLRIENFIKYNLTKKFTTILKFVIILFFISIIYFLLYIFYLNYGFNKFETKIKIKTILNSLELALHNQNEISKAQNKILLKLVNKKDKKNILYRLKLLKIISNNNILKYKGVENCLLNDPDSQYCIYHLICPKTVLGKKRILIGEKSDGSYVLLDDFKDIKIAYSFGISKEIHFDKI